jgi:hypothetical protein
LIQEAEGAHVQNHGVNGELSVLQKVGVVAPDIIGAELFERRVNVLPEMLYRLQIRLNRRCGVVAAYEFFPHPLNKCRHRDLLSLRQHYPSSNPERSGRPPRQRLRCVLGMFSSFGGASPPANLMEVKA